MSQFGDDVAKEVKTIKDTWRNSITTDSNAEPSKRSVDKSVIEQVSSEFDKIIDKHQTAKKSYGYAAG